MALHSGVSGGGAVAKRPPSSTLSRRRARGSLVRCRAYVWSKDDLAKLNTLPMPPPGSPVDDGEERQGRAYGKKDHVDVTAALLRRLQQAEDKPKRGYGLTRMARSEGNLLASGMLTATLEAQEEGAAVHMQSPRQASMCAVASIASTLINLNL